MQRLLRDQMDWVAELAAMIDAHPDFERLAPTPLSTVCFRYRPGAGTTDEGCALAEVDEDAWADANKELIARVIINLLTNAIRYNEKGGTVKVSLRATSDAVVLEVADTGIGIRPEDLSQIFDRFYRVDQARSRRAGGSGLGLSISRAIIDAHRGSISCQSEPGKGSTFTVQLPVR